MCAVGVCAVGVCRVECVCVCSGSVCMCAVGVCRVECEYIYYANGFQSLHVTFTFLLTLRFPSLPVLTEVPRPYFMGWLLVSRCGGGA